MASVFRRRGYNHLKDEREDEPQCLTEGRILCLSVWSCVGAVFLIGYVIAVGVTVSAANGSVTYSLFPSTSMPITKGGVWEDGMSFSVGQSGAVSAFKFDRLPPLANGTIAAAPLFNFSVQSYGYYEIDFWMNTGSSVTVSWPGLDLGFYYLVGPLNYGEAGAFAYLDSQASYSAPAGPPSVKTFSAVIKSDNFHTFVLTNRDTNAAAPGYLSFNITFTLYDTSGSSQSCVDVSTCHFDFTGPTAVILEVNQCSDTQVGCPVTIKPSLRASLWTAVLLPIGLVVISPFVVCALCCACDVFCQRWRRSQRAKEAVAMAHRDAQ